MAPIGVVTIYSGYDERLSDFLNFVARSEANLREIDNLIVRSEGGGGGGNSVENVKPKISNDDIHDAIQDCASSLFPKFDILIGNFAASDRGVSGSIGFSFTQTVTGWLDNAYNIVERTITNNTSRYTVAQLTSAHATSPNEKILGLTEGNSSENYTGSDVGDKRYGSATPILRGYSDPERSRYLFVQIHEFGHSLSNITGQKLGKEDGAIFNDCVFGSLNKSYDQRNKR